MQRLLSHITSYYPLSEDSRSALENAFEGIRLSRNDHLLKEGSYCRSLYFLEKGAVRGYYNIDGKEVTHWFGFENDFITSLHSFITHTPAVENIQLMEDSMIWAVSREKLAALLDQSHETERLLRIIYEKYYIRLEERFINAQFKTATERYENLIDRMPHILERASLGHIASYLGISQETLSRIRAKL